MSKLLSKIRRKVKSLATPKAETEDAMTTPDSSPPSETADPCCYWCSRISLRGFSYSPSRDEREWLQELFHSDCECRRSEYMPPSSACGFCKHLNIRHLVCCTLFPHDSEFPRIFSDWYCRKNPQNGCQLCKYIASHGISDSEIGLGIRKFQWNSYYLLKLQGTDKDAELRFLQDSVSQLQEHVNWEQIRGWLSETYEEKENLPVDFRVIDVERNCIVTPGYPVDYVALSYVWGSSTEKAKPFQANMHNIKDLEIEGSLSGAPLPRTITDAMEVCRQLGRQYLWVDRLCIIQDDESKHGQIQRMDSIFGSSEFTIIALSGQDANDGLQGVSKPRKSCRLTIFECQGITFTDSFPYIENLVERSYWAQRGWTFQEEFCSRKNLYFTEYGVYYSSRDKNTPNTECVAEVSEAPTQSFEFPESVEAYAARSFTDPGDLLRAFTGVLNMEFDYDHYFGNAAPRSGYSTTTFYEWIHWQPVDWEYEARSPPKDIFTETVSHIQTHKSDIFPSWSWTSARGGVRFNQRIDPVALWAFPVAQESQKDSNVEWVSTNREASRLREITVEGRLMRARDFPFQPPEDRELEMELISASPTLFNKVDRDEAHKKLGRILSFAQVASLRLESLDDHFRYDGRRTFRIMSSADECMGGIWLPRLSLEYTSNMDGSLKEREFEFMALSVDHNIYYIREESILDDIGLEDSKDRAKLNVMLIHYGKDSNVARRLGIGQVFRDQWFKERPVLKTVILE